MTVAHPEPAAAPRANPVRALHRCRERVADLTPAAEPGTSPRFVEALGLLSVALLDANAALIGRFAPHRPAVVDARGLPWTRALESSWPDIRDEVDRYLRDHHVFSTAEVMGLVPEGPTDDTVVPHGPGRWGVVLLATFGRTVTGNAIHFPATMRALRDVPAIANVGFLCLEAHSHLALHRDPNRGALRVQLPITAPDGPDGPGGCRIVVNDRAVELVERRVTMFDLAEPHEAWNDTDGRRVSLAFEVLAPLPGPLAVTNRLAQWAYRFLPSFRGLHARAERLAAQARSRSAA